MYLGKHLGRVVPQPDPPASAPSARPADPLTQKLEADTARIIAAQPIARAIVEGRKMAKPSYAAERLKALKASIESETDKLIAEIEAVASKDIPAAFDHGRAFLQTQRADVQALRDELAPLVNLPLSPTE